MRSKLILLLFLFFCNLANASLCRNVQRTQVVKSDCDALVAFYQATNGGNWTHNDNWLSDKPVRDWEGVGVRGNRVTALKLYGNNLSGVIPSAIGNLSKLRYLKLTHNQLTGAIPRELAQLSELEVLDLSSNQLSDIIPAELAQLSKLRFLALDHNQLTGAIPSELGQLAQLTTLILSNNMLVGDIPGSITQLRRLINLVLDRNQLSGTIPSRIMNLTELRRLHLFRNRLSGEIPVGIEYLTSLKYLYLSHNNLRGSFTENMVLPKLIAINLSHNCLDELASNVEDLLIHQGIAYEYDPQNQCRIIIDGGGRIPYGGGRIPYLVTGESENSENINDNDLNSESLKSPNDNEKIEKLNENVSDIDEMIAIDLESFEIEVKEIRESLLQEITEDLYQTKSIE